MKDNSLFDLTGKKALVTGAAVGVGRACAIALARAGADIAIVDVNRHVGEKTAASLRELGVEVSYIQCDISDQLQVESMVNTVVERFGRIDIVINNAGIGVEHSEDESFELTDWDKLMSINLKGLWHCCCAVARQMCKQSPIEGKLINIASIAGVCSLPISNGAYDASKAAVIHLTKQLAVQWGRFNINVNSISPGYVMTPMMAEMDKAFLKRIRETTPMGYVGRPEDLYGVTVFLAAQASDYLTGQNIVVDGGHTLGPWMMPVRERDVAARIDPEAEILELQKDLASQ